MADDLNPGNNSYKESIPTTNSPELDASGTQHIPALTSLDQAVTLVKALQKENKEREIKNARILEKYNSERPYRPEQLQADGLTWKNNFSTKPLSTLIDKVVPRFTTAIDNMRYFTASKLQDDAPGADAKTETFRREVTKTIRSHKLFSDFKTDIAQENALFGYTAVGWLDTWSWLPKQFCQDSFLTPVGTRHTADSTPVVCLRQGYLLYELYDLIRDQESAKLAGWNVEEVIQSINNAVPENLRSNNSDPYRMYADLNRESSVLTSFAGSKKVFAWHIFVTEVDGTVSHLIYDEHSEKQLFYKQKQYPSMSDAAAFYSFQHGSGKLQGSKGIGRELYAMAGMLDRARNEVVDRMQLGGKLVLRCDEKDIAKFRMSVVGSCILIGNAYQVEQTQIQTNVEQFLELDKFLTDLLDEIAGSTSPKVIEGDRVTKAQVELFAGREEERRDNVISRFLRQFANMVTTMQKRLCDPDSPDPAAKELQQKLLKVMSPQELQYISNQPAVETVTDYSEIERQQIVVIAQAARGNPLYNQREIEKRSLTAQVDAEFAEAVLLPEQDPTVHAENMRQQMVENGMLQTGNQVPVSPRDNHAVHFEVMRNSVQAILPAAVSNPQIEQVLAQYADHAQAHLQMAEQTGQGQDPDIVQARQWLAKLQSTLEQLQAEAQRAVAEATDATQPSPTAAPPNAAASPPQ